ncbi:SDR family oxidoreductase [Nocardia sp. NBC_01377]|uniref:SDR family oxidoreductase n=1 Tax=Nocardia sp. NBC_01377 TaxID=2903595 RepID=UPI0032446114
MARLDTEGRALAVELAPVRVNVIQPGVIRTELWDRSVPDPEAFLHDAASALLTQRVGTPEEAAAAYLFILDNAYVTGTTLAIDGAAPPTRPPPPSTPAHALGPGTPRFG